MWQKRGIQDFFGRQSPEDPFSAFFPKKRVRFWRKKLSRVVEAIADAQLYCRRLADRDISPYWAMGPGLLPFAIFTIRGSDGTDRGNNKDVVAASGCVKNTWPRPKLRRMGRAQRGPLRPAVGARCARPTLRRHLFLRIGKGTLKVSLREIIMNVPSFSRRCSGQGGGHPEYNRGEPWMEGVEAHDDA